MGTSIFGTPITNETLNKLTEFENQDDLTRWDRARVAFQQRNADDKHISARKFVREIRTDCKGMTAGTECLIYNATGDPIQLAGFYDFVGKITMSPYPIIIDNGQWGVFFHGRFHPNSPAVDSVGAVVYEGKNADDRKCQWVLAWKNKAHLDYQNLTNVCYTDIRNPREGHLTFDTKKEKWESVFTGNIVNQKGVMQSISEDSGCKAYASIADTYNEYPVILEAIFTLTDPKDLTNPCS